ncbi:CoA transferase [Streptomyces sp. O3]
MLVDRGWWSRHLAQLGLDARPVDAAGGQWEVTYGPAAHRPLTLRLASARRSGLAEESALQAGAGLMVLFGLREQDGPRRLGVGFASAVSAVAAGQGVLAALLGQARGTPQPTSVSVNPGTAVLFSQSHHLELAAAGPDTAAFGTGQPPPFRTSDGRLVEVETFRPERWAAFWRLLGADPREAGQAWRSHEARQWTACCRVPLGLHTAAFRPLADLRAAADSTGVCVVPLDGTAGDRLTEPWSLSPAPTPSSQRPAVAWEGSGQPPPSDLPLSGLTVLEATHYLQGPYTGRVLAMLGARVIRLEPPQGDPARGVEPVTDGCSVAFRALHRGKEPLLADLTRSQGRRLAHEATARADVFLTNWSPGLLERTQLGPAVLRRINPALTYARAGGGPADDDAWPHTATDWSIQAASGLARAVRPDGESPAVSQLTLLDPLGGLLCAQGVLAALLHQQHTGQVSRVDTSLLHAARFLRAFPRSRPGPALHPLPTADGHLAVEDTPALRRTLGLTDTADRVDFTRALAPRTARDWERELTRTGITATRVRGLSEILAAPADTGWLRYAHNGPHAARPWNISA